ncbi:hypothetical protein GCWU000341_00880 [Oribacterium sp. oral taxon 078 str. F0262]|nr:hypothetical protein GCWU000341_00880 [Oribacterium sp. oral taxon 078 str. F0262]
MHRDDSVAAKTELVEILGFKRFYEHFTFDFTFEETDWSIRGKRLEKYVWLLIAIELVTVGTKKEARKPLCFRQKELCFRGRGAAL